MSLTMRYSRLFSTATMWTKIKNELNHYWKGTKDFASETKTSSQLLWKSYRGTELSRRERLQLSRTGADLIRLVPFSIFIIVPFLELLLPFVLRIFPNLLPSTFEYDDNRTRRLKTSALAQKRASDALHSILLEISAPSDSELQSSDAAQDKSIVSLTASAKKLAKVLQESHISAASQPISERLSEVHSFILNSGLDPLKFAPEILYGDKLLRICQLLRISDLGGTGTPYIPGSDIWRRYLLASHINILKKDDDLIRKEGVDSLLPAELIHACEKRGIQTHDKVFTSTSSDLSETGLEILRSDLQQWLDLTGHYGFPMLVVILSSVLKHNK